MKDKRLAQVLAVYADDLTRGLSNREAYLRQISDRSGELEALLNITERIQQTLVPVQPSAAFVKDLARQLTDIGSRKVEGAVRDHWQGLFIGVAAIGSALSVIGLVAYLVRNRGQVKPQVISMG